MKRENPKLSSIVLNDSAGIFRNIPIKGIEKSSKRYPFLDYTTLAYEVFRDSDETVTLICPRLLNLWPTLKNGLQQNGISKPLKLRRKIFTKWEQISLKMPEKEKILRFSNPNHEISNIPISIKSYAFEDTNVLLTVLKDENPDWIADWINYHKEHHRANAALIFNNNSSTYDSEQLAQILKRECKLEQIMVIDAHFPYGSGSAEFGVKHEASWLQNSCLNIARLNYLRNARAVLSIDIDEFIKPLNRSTVFDKAVNSFGGLVSFRGQWAYPEIGGTSRAQRDHIYESKDPRDSTLKWCAAPGSWLGGTEWKTHGHGGLHGRIVKRKNIGHWHFRATTTSWKWDRLDFAEGAIRSDEVALALRVLT